jgi:hypothetical protein
MQLSGIIILAFVATNARDVSRYSLCLCSYLILFS